MNIELTSHCKVMFTEWYKEYEPKSDWKYPAYEYFKNHNIEYQLSVATMFFDAQEIFIHTEPYLGGGQPLFFGKVHYRMPDNNIDTYKEVMNGEEPHYCIDRLEMIDLCIAICNDVYNEGFDVERLPKKEVNYYASDELPF